MEALADVRAQKLILTAYQRCRFWEGRGSVHFCAFFTGGHSTGAEIARTFMKPSGRRSGSREDFRKFIFPAAVILEETRPLRQRWSGISRFSRLSAVIFPAVFPASSWRLRIRKSAKAHL